MVGKPLNITRRTKDPSALTPYEQKIYDLKQLGLDWKQIAAELGNKNPASASGRWHVIQEKLGVK